MRLTLAVDGTSYEVQLHQDDAGLWQATVDGEMFPVTVLENGAGLITRVAGEPIQVHADAAGNVRVAGQLRNVKVLELHGTSRGKEAATATRHSVKAPMNGTIEKVNVKVGDDVKRGDVLFVLVAMKMQNEVKAASDGKVTAVKAKAADTVTPQSIVVELE